jgi:nitroreductase
MIMSNVVIDLLNKRYSARKFQSKKIKHNTINYILNAGRMAPSGAMSNHGTSELSMKNI